MNMLNKNSVKELKQNKRINNFADGIAAAFFDSMRYDPPVLAFGLGATDPKNIFGTMAGLKDAFGNERVFDTPIYFQIGIIPFN